MYVLACMLVFKTTSIFSSKLYVCIIIYHKVYFFTKDAGSFCFCKILFFYLYILLICWYPLLSNPVTCCFLICYPGSNATFMFLFIYIHKKHHLYFVGSGEDWKCESSYLKSRNNDIKGTQIWSFLFPLWPLSWLVTLFLSCDLGKSE